MLSVSWEEEEEEQPISLSFCLSGGDLASGATLGSRTSRSSCNLLLPPTPGQPEAVVDRVEPSLSLSFSLCTTAAVSAVLLFFSAIQAGVAVAAATSKTRATTNYFPLSYLIARHCSATVQGDDGSMLKLLPPTAAVMVEEGVEKGEERRGSKYRNSCPRPPACPLSLSLHI
jgi:hypothetical protein